MAATKTRLLVGLAAVGALTLAGCGGSTGTRGDNASQAANGPSVTETPTTTPTPAAPLVTFGPGTYAIPDDVTPGTYHTEGAVPGSSVSCYWERDKDTSGSVGSIIANSLGTGPATVTIAQGDGAFKTANCQPWNLTHGK